MALTIRDAPAMRAPRSWSWSSAISNSHRMLGEPSISTRYRPRPVAKPVAEVLGLDRDVRLRPVRGDVVAHARHVVDDESRFAADVTGQRRAHRRDRPGRDVAGGRVERLAGGDAFDALLDVVDLDAQSGGELVQDRAPAEGEHSGRGRERA